MTAVFTLSQVEKILQQLNKKTKTIISVFAGRIADAGIDPEAIIVKSVELAKDYPNVEILWASPRESFNIIQANNTGCDIITVSYGLLKKTENFGKDLEQYSLETVEMFYILNEAISIDQYYKWIKYEFD